MVSVVCSIAIAVLINGHRENLNIVDLNGLKIDVDKGDYILVNFSHTLPKEYTYLAGPELLVNENNCLYLNGTN